MRTVTCICENRIEADLPEQIDLDAETGRIREILDKSFFVIACPKCGTRIAPELQVRLTSRSRNMDVIVLPELERMSLYRGKVDVPKGATVLVGYAELRERAQIIADGLDPDCIEIIKYFLLLKAEERAPQSDVSIRYDGIEEGDLVFKAAGIKEGELAVLRIGRDLYEQTLADKARTLRSEPFDRVFAGPYRSVRSLEAEED